MNKKNINLHTYTHVSIRPHQGTRPRCKVQDKDARYKVQGAKHLARYKVEFNIQA